MNVGKIKKFGMQAVDRIVGEGGSQYNLDKAYNEHINRILTSFRNDKFFEAKLKSHKLNNSNK